MNEIIRIEDVEVQKLVYRDQPVLTYEDIDRVHGRPEGTAKRNFNEHRDKLTFGRDFFELPYEEWSILPLRTAYDQEDDSSDQNKAGGYRGNKIFMTLRGYLKVVKSFRDERAWRVHDILVDSYFDLKVLQKAAQKDVDFMELQKKYVFLLEDTVKRLQPKPKKPFVVITDEEKQQIMELHKQGVSRNEIARQIGRSRPGVSQIIKRECLEGQIKELEQKLKD